MLLAFASGATAMALELDASRMLAPYFGVSLYTWASVIGVVLAGLSLGGYVGGRVADRYPGRGTLSVFLAMASLSVLSVPLAIELAPGLDPGRTLPLVLRIVLVVALTFLGPSIALGTVLPAVIRLETTQLESTGRTVGRLYAASAAGSIAGTFATGLALVEWVGTRGIVWGVASVLLALALLARGRRDRSARDVLTLPGQAPNPRLRWASSALIAAAFVALGASFAFRDRLRAPCLSETSYYCIDVGEARYQDQTIKALVLDHLVHSLNSLEDPTHLEYPYERIYADLTAFAASRIGAPADMATLFVGGGGYTFPRYVEAVYPSSAIDVVEIDPMVTEVSYRELGLHRQTRIRSFNQDARQFFLERRPRQAYDVVYGDAFNDLSIPYHLTTHEFNEAVRAALKPDGWYLANVIDDPVDGVFLPAYANTLRKTYPHVHLFVDPAARGRAGSGGGGASSRALAKIPLTYVVAASSQPLDVTAFLAAVGRLGRQPAGVPLPESEVAALLGRGALTLTDDYAPVDNLLAPVFLRRGY